MTEWFAAAVNFFHFPQNTTGSVLRAVFIATVVSAAIYLLEVIKNRTWITWKEKGSLRIDALYILVSAADGVVFTKLIFSAYAVMIPSFPNHYLGQGHGLLSYISSSLWFSVLAGLIITDLIGYIMHRIFHEVPMLWRFHAVHHVVTDNYSLNGNRFHPFNLLLGRARAAFMILVGWPILDMVIVNLCISICNKYAHGKFYGLPRWVHHFLITPEYHIYHHAVKPEWRDKNYASMFPILDKIFGTYCFPKAEDPLKVVMGCDDPVPPTFIGQMIYPFKAIFQDLRPRIPVKVRSTE